MSVDLDDYILVRESNGKNRTKYKCYCSDCGKDRGYLRKERWHKKCRSCVQVGKVKSHEEKIKHSCMKQGINIEDFDGFTKKSTERLRIKFDKRGLAKKCFESVDFTCQKCGVRGGNLNAHHINNWANYPEHRFNLKNLACLCYKCHREFHKQFGFKDNNLEQFKEYIGLNRRVDLSVCMV